MPDSTPRSEGAASLTNFSHYASSVLKEGGGSQHDLCLVFIFICENLAPSLTIRCAGETIATRSARHVHGARRQPVAGSGETVGGHCGPIVRSRRRCRR